MNGYAQDVLYIAKSTWMCGAIVSVLHGIKLSDAIVSGLHGAPNNAVRLVKLCM